MNTLSSLVLKRGRDIFVEGREEFSFFCDRELTSLGMRSAAWEYSSSQYETTIYSLILLRLQGQRQPLGVL